MKNQNFNASGTVGFEYKPGIRVIAQVLARVETDNSYGADADGNRGTSMDFIEDVQVTDVEIEIVKTGETKSLSFSKLRKSNRVAIEELAADAVDFGDIEPLEPEPQEDYSKED